MNNDKIIEWCSECGMESEISINGGKCTYCGKWLKPCSNCNMNIVNCNLCKFGGNYGKRRNK